MIASLKNSTEQQAESGAAERAGSAWDKKIILYVIQTTCIFWLVTKLIGWKLWTTERLLPTAPPFDFLTAPGLVHLLLFAASLLLMAALILKPASKGLLNALFITELTACLFDQNRWQPWEYQFVFILFIYIINYKRQHFIASGLTFVMISTYAYSGVGKLNSSFLLMFWDNMLLHRYFKIPHTVISQPLIHYSGYLVAIAELLLGLGLLFRASRKMAAAALILMHLLIIVLVGPTGLNYNIVVWPWNILMMIHLYLLFIHKRALTINLQQLWTSWNVLIVICWGILPAFNHTVGWWDNFLSSRLFAGNQPHMEFCIKDSGEIKQLSPYLNKGKKNIGCDSNAVMVNLQRWAMKETKSPPYIEERVYKKIARKWIQEHKGSSTRAILFYYGKKGELIIVNESEN
jgi:hypothetical protein